PGHSGVVGSQHDDSFAALLHDRKIGHSVFLGYPGRWTVPRSLTVGLGPSDFPLLRWPSCWVAWTAPCEGSGSMMSRASRWRARSFHVHRNSVPIRRPVRTGNWLGTKANTTLPNSPAVRMPNSSMT